MGTRMRVLGGLAAASALLVSGSALADISGSAHDFSGETWNPGGEMCVVCHAPHNNRNASGELLWNHASTGVTNFTAYTSGTFSIVTPGQPDGTSKVCLSCHDGTVGLDSFGVDVNGDPVVGTTTMTGYALVGTDLSNDHPISFVYNATGEDLNATSFTVTALSGTIAETMLDSAGKVQCSSCHDVHNSYPNASLLKVDNGGSALCTTCHTK